jgi:CHAT domain-containing protein
MAIVPLPLRVRDFDNLLAQFQFDLACALKACAYKGPYSDAASNLTPAAQGRLNGLYRALIAPLADYLRGRQRVTIVPYGALHYLPFHLLYDAGQYLIEQHEVVVLPAAGLLLGDKPQRAGRARILAHSWEGRLPHTQQEAEMVRAILGGQVCYDADAGRESLFAPPGQVLHIAAHGEYRIDQPDLSYIYLADGQLYTDDLLQLDMSYELVTLSACETGRARAVPGDELVGLGRGFLYAGAGALVASLWRVDDILIVRLMEHLYRALQAGASKAAALRDAQRLLLADAPRLHPAFWGAFQLVGNPSPLSRYS